MKKHNRPFTIQRRLFLSFLGLTLFLSICISFCSYIITFRVLRERVSSSYRFTLDHIANSIKIETDRIENLTNFIFVNDTIKKAILLSNENTIESINLDYQAYSSLKHYFLSHNLLDINSISIIGENGYHLFYYSNLDEQELQVLPEIIAESKTILTASAGNVVWGGLKPKFFGTRKLQSYEIRLYRSIKNKTYTENIGFIFVSLKPRLFSKLIRIYDSTYPDFAEKTGIYVTHNEFMLVNSGTLNIDENLVLNTLGMDEAYSSHGYAIPETNHISFVKSIEGTPWKVIGVIPKTLIQVDNTYILLISMVAFILCIIICALVWFYISTYIFRPLHELSGTIRKIEKGDKDLRAVVSDNDEIGVLSHNFNRMLDQNENLFRKNLQKEIEIKEAQYQTLQAQINPHFLYNTLNSIRWMAIMIKADNIKQAIDAFWSISKYNFEIDKKYISVGEELEIVRQYIYLQQIAYKNSFEVKWKIAPEVSEFRCIKFFLQPLVENGIKHGILQAERLGTIGIGVKELPDSIEFNIKDTGVGMDEGIIEKIFDIEGKPSGLSNIIYRLKLAYGDQYRFEIESEVDKYTSLIITIPKEKNCIYD